MPAFKIFYNPQVKYLINFFLLFQHTLCIFSEDREAQLENALESIKLWDCVLEDEEKLRVSIMDERKAMTFERYQQIIFINFLNYATVIEITCQEAMLIEDVDRVKIKLMEINEIRKKYIALMEKWLNLIAKTPHIYQSLSTEKIFLEIYGQYRSLVHENELQYFSQSFYYLQKYFDHIKKCGIPKMMKNLGESRRRYIPSN